MPTFNLPFFKRTSAPPPGSSEYVSNAIIVAKRAALGLEEPVRIQSGVTWGAGNPLFDWCQRHTGSEVECMQLRKETKAPFYHEYVAFRLSDGYCFRIDRRQRQDEQSPLNCTRPEGVEAFDTIEQIVDMEHSMYSPSDCLIQLDFRGSPLGRLVQILRNISQHKWAHVYTVQRYNCYFYAQTVLLCTLACVCGYNEMSLWNVSDSSSYENSLRYEPSPLTSFRKNVNVTIKLRRITQEAYYRALLERQPVVGSFLPRGGPAWRAWNARRRKLKKMFERTTEVSLAEQAIIGDVPYYLSEKIYAHSVRVEQHILILGQTAREVHVGIKVAMNDVWEELLKSLPPPETTEQQATEEWFAGTGLGLNLINRSWVSDPYRDFNYGRGGSGPLNTYPL